MPHIKDAEKVVIHDTAKLEKEGHLCFIFAEGALAEYNLAPKWSTIHKIKRAMRNPYHTEWSHQLVMKYAGSYDRQDIETAAELAFIEFYRIVGARYEDGMILQNGNCFKGAKIPSLSETYVIEDGRPATPTLSPVQLAFQAAEPSTPVTVDSKGDLMPDHTVEQCEPACFEGQPALVVPAKKRGRPAGSKNKVTI